MANVLPEGARKSVWGFYRSRFILVGSIGLCICGLCAILALFPAYLALRTEGTFAGVPSIDAGVQRGKDSERDQLLRTRMLLDQFAFFASSSVPVLDAFVSALGKRPAGVVVDRMSYRQDAGGGVTIGGAATSREGVSAYVAALRSDPGFGNVSVPISDLAGTGDGRFSITLTGTF